MCLDLWGTLLMPTPVATRLLSCEVRLPQRISSHYLSDTMAFTYGPDSGPCAVCEKPSARPCSRCRVDFYCGKEHQTQDWPRHRKGCGVLAVESNEALGRFVVATRAIPAGTILMREVPLVSYPVVLLPHVACVGCCVRLPVGPLQGCRRCGFPVCGEACSLKEVHLPECSAFQRAGFKLSTTLCREDETYMNALKALRVHLATQQMPQGPRLAELKSDILPHAQSEFPEEYACELRRILDQTSTKIVSVVSWLRGVVGINWIPSKDLERSMGMIFMNALRGPCDPNDATTFQAVSLFAGISMLKHSCVPNAFTYPWHLADGSNRDREHVLVAATDIARGEHVTVTYLDASIISETPTRRLSLLNWSFFCRCKLCSDPTELGLNLTAWYCGYCNRKGRRCLVNVLDVCRWICVGCGKGGYIKADAEGNGWAEVSRLESRIKELRESGAKVRREVWEGLLTETLGTGGLLHPTQALVLQVKKELAFESIQDELAEAAATDTCMSEKAGVLRQGLAYTRELLRVMDVLQPGISPPRRDCLMNLFTLTQALLGLPGNENNKDLGMEYLILYVKMQQCLINPLEKKTFPPIQEY